VEHSFLSSETKVAIFGLYMMLETMYNDIAFQCRMRTVWLVEQYHPLKEIAPKRGTHEFKENFYRIPI
jgi:hypothetical protein